jgi:hypothetical protein
VTVLAVAMILATPATIEAFERDPDRRRWRIMPTVDEALETVDELAAAGPVDLWLEEGLVADLPRPMQASAGWRIDLDAAEVLACMRSDGQVRRVHRFEADAAAGSMPRGVVPDVFIAVVEHLEAQPLERLLSLSGLDEARQWRCRDAAAAVARGGRLCIMRCRGAPVRLGPNDLVVHHASRTRLAEPGHSLIIDRDRPLWTSVSPAFAACFGCPAVRDGRVIHGHDPLESRPTVVISLEAEHTLPDLDGGYFLHRLIVPAAGVREAGACHGLEHLVTGHVHVDRVDGPLDPSDLEKDFGVMVEHRDSRGASLAMLLENVSDDRIDRVFGMPRDAMVGFPSMRRQLAVWLPDELGLAPSRVPGFSPPAALRCLRRLVLPEAASLATFPSSPGHGLPHAWMISHLALLLAMLEDVPPLGPCTAAILHDIGREHDAEDDRHAEAGASIASRIIPSMMSAALNPTATLLAVEAIAGHSLADKAPHPTAAILRDADRLPLAWERGPDPSGFATTWGLRLAAAGVDGAERAFRRVFGVPLFETAGVDTDERVDVRRPGPSR